MLGGSWKGMWWKADVEWRTDLINKGKEGLPLRYSLSIFAYISGERCQPRNRPGWTCSRPYCCPALTPRLLLTIVGFFYMHLHYLCIFLCYLVCWKMTGCPERVSKIFITDTPCWFNFSLLFKPSPSFHSYSSFYSFYSLSYDNATPFVYFRIFSLSRVQTSLSRFYRTRLRVYIIIIIIVLLLIPIIIVDTLYLRLSIAVAFIALD